MPDSPTATLSPLPPGGGLPPEPQKQATDDERRNSLMTRLSTTHKDVKDIGEDELFNMLDKDHSGEVGPVQCVGVSSSDPYNVCFLCVPSSIYNIRGDNVRTYSHLFY